MPEPMERLKKVVAELLKIDAGSIQDHSRFVEVLGADSMQSIELVAAFEEEFEIEMDEDDALAVKNIADAARFIEKILTGQS